MNAITIRNLSKVYANGTVALKNIDLDVAAGDFFALLGANGAGKTTMIGILIGLVNKTSGKVEIFGNDLDNRHRRAKIRKSIGVVPQEINFSIFEKVNDILVIQAGYFGISRRMAIAESEIILKKLGLWEMRHMQSRTLSGGMKRRLLIARALIHRPKLLILDEPTAGVDVELRHSMWDYLRELNQNGTTILLTTHYLEEVEQMCRNAAIIKSGEIIHHDSVGHLIQSLDKVTYVITVKQMKPLDNVQNLNFVIVDDNSIEIELDRNESINDYIIQLSNLGIYVTDIRPKENRLEKMFLNTLKD
ncbi:MAG: ABC transporter ATP-binding protein [Spirochaetota bacterium]|nr:ABC transporter ATP-binding protein [Spirochaetota bacterium]